jgi:hypothetical protein
MVSIITVVRHRERAESDIRREREHPQSSLRCPVLECTARRAVNDDHLAIRAAIVNHRTESSDIDALVEATLAFARADAKTRPAETAPAPA